MRKLLIVLALTVLPVVAQAQTKTLEYSYLATTLAEINTYQQIVRVNSTTLTTPPVCVQDGTDVHCSIPITTNPGVNNVISVTALLNGQAAETVVNYNPSAPGPKQPSNGRIKIVVIVNVP